MSANEVTDADVIPSAKIKQAYEICMKDPKLAKYFNEAPAGARQYIALMFYCTVFNEELNDELCAKYQAEVEEELTREDVLYLAENESDPITKMHFRRLYVAMAKAEEAQKVEETSFADETSAEKMAASTRTQVGQGVVVTGTPRGGRSYEDTGDKWVFSHVHKRIKNLARAIFWIGFALSLLIPFGGVTLGGEKIVRGVDMGEGFGILAASLLISGLLSFFFWLITVPIYAFGQLLEDTARIRRKLDA